MDEGRLCPKCGAYWACDCVLDDLSYAPVRNCDHDWVEAVGVELTEDLASEDTQVYLCRLCGIYAVGDVNEQIRPL